MTQKFINNYSTTVAQTFGTGDTYLRVTSSAGLPVLGVGEYFLLTVFRKVGQNESGHEVVKVTEVVSDQLTVQRSIEGAAASTFIVGDRVEARLTAGSLDSFTDAAKSDHVHPLPSAAAISAEPAITKSTGFAKWTGSVWSFDNTSYQTQQSVTGIVKSSGTTRSAAVAGTDYLAPGGALTTPSSGNLSNCTADGTNQVGFRNVPQNSKSAAYTCVLADAGKHILHPAADTTDRTFTIPANASVAYPIGTAITFVNQNGTGGVVTIAITTDTMRLAGEGTTGSRTLARNGTATALKITATEWIISGVGLT